MNNNQNVWHRFSIDDGKDDDDSEGLKAKCFTPACDIYVPIYRKKYYAFVPVTNGVHTCPGNMLQFISTTFNFWPNKISQYFLTNKRKEIFLIFIYLILTTQANCDKIDFAAKQHKSYHLFGETKWKELDIAEVCTRLQIFYLIDDFAKISGWLMSLRKPIHLICCQWNLFLETTWKCQNEANL